MKQLSTVALLTGLLTTSGLLAPAVAQRTGDAPAALVNQFCLACHSAAGKAGGLVLQGLDPARASAHPDVWEKVIRKIRSGEMPPPGRPRPDAPILTAFVGKLISNLDVAAERAPYAGRPVVRRINRTEYGNAIRDLLAIDQDFASDLPPDGVAAGFDNIGDALSMSPLLLERYLKTAHKISRLAVGTGDSMPIAHEFPRHQDTGRMARSGDALRYTRRGFDPPLFSVQWRLPAPCVLGLKQWVIAR